MFMDFQAERVDHVTCSQCGCAIVTVKAQPLGTVTCPQCQTPVRVPARFDDHFLLTQVLGKGTSGIVFKAFDEQLQRSVAIKVLRRGSAEEERIALECIREARALAAINHPGIVQIYSIGQYRDQHYIVMELGKLGRADKFLGTDRPLDEAHVLEMGIAVAGGLAAAHRVGLVHMDVKPGNILLAPGHKAKLIDFGAAQYARPSEPDIHDDKGQAIIGTPYYIAPEVLRGSPPDFKADLYSLGATLFHLLTGRPPFPGHRPMEVMRQRLKRPAPWPGDVRADLHPETSQVIFKMLATDPADRYDNYAQVIAALDEALAATLEGPADPLEANLARMAAVGKPADGDKTLPPHDGSVDQPPPRPPLSPVQRWILIVGVLGLIAGVSWLGYVRSHPPPPPPPPPPANQPPKVVAPALKVLSVVKAGDIVGAVQASDPDSDDPLTYAIQAPPSGITLPFAIDDQGRISVTDTAAIQAQVGYVYQLSVRVTDKGQPPRSTTAEMRIAIVKPDPHTYQLIAHWPLADEPTDVSPNQLNGTVYGNPSFVLTLTQPREKAMHLNGNDAVVVRFTDKLNPAGDMTVLCRVRLPSGLEQKPNAGLVTRGAAGWRLQLNGKVAGQFVFAIGKDRVVGRGDYFNDGKWHDVAAIRQANQLRLYVDGLLEGKAEMTAAAAPTDKADLAIGSNSADLKAYGLRGYLRDIWLFGRALDEQDLESFYEPAK